MLLNWLDSGAEKLALPGAQRPVGQLEGFRRFHEPLGRWFDGFLDHWLAP